MARTYRRDKTDVKVVEGQHAPHKRVPKCIPKKAIARYAKRSTLKFYIDHFEHTMDLD